VIYSPIRRELSLFYMSGPKTRNAPDENKSVNVAEVERLVALSNPALLTWVGAGRDRRAAVVDEIQAFLEKDRACASPIF